VKADEFQALIGGLATEFPSFLAGASRARPAYQEENGTPYLRLVAATAARRISVRNDIN
jgi:hypothetical protein